MKKKVLFICVHNSARSQIAEELLRKYGGDTFETESAGLEPTEVNPLVIEVMKEEGVDLTNKKTQSVFDVVKRKTFFGYVVTVCDRQSEKKCPVFPGVPMRMHWDLVNPEDYTGTYEQRLEKVRNLKEKIKELVLDFIKENG
jgi:arsenate reductase (thioredoxin)